MIRLTEIAFGSATPIDGYGPGFFRIGGEVLHGAVIVTENGACLWSGYEDAASLIALADRIDILLLGTGVTLVPPPAAFTGALAAAGMGADPMASPTAARAYNMLLAEGRRIAAALLPVA